MSCCRWEIDVFGEAKPDGEEGWKGMPYHSKKAADRKEVKALKKRKAEISSRQADPRESGADDVRGRDDYG